MNLPPHLQCDMRLAHVNPFEVLRDSDGIIAAEVETLWDKLEMVMGVTAFEDWIKTEHPTLLQMRVDRAWWLLNNKLQEVVHPQPPSRDTRAGEEAA
jgi:hypothetical protein